MIGIPHPLTYVYLALYLIALVVLFAIPCAIQQWKRYVVYVSCVSLLFVVSWFFADIKDTCLPDTLRFSHVAGVAVGFVVRHLFDPQRILSRLCGLAVMLLIFVGGPAGYQYGKIVLFKRSLPSPIEVADAVHIDRGYKKECGMAVFMISPQTKLLIQTSTPADLLELWRVSDPEYSEWGRTPYQLTGSGVEAKDRWLNGIFCAHADDGQRQEIVDAVNGNDAFYARAENSGIVVIPKRNWLVYSYAD